MNFGRIVGTLVLNKAYPSLEGITLKILEPTDETGKPVADPLVVADTVGSNEGDLVTWVTSAEAALSLPNPFNPASAAVMSIIDILPNGEKV